MTFVNIGARIATVANAERVTGPAGGQLAANVRALREDRRLNQPQLASRMEALGAGIHASAISKIEKRERRVDVDDLVALAVALDTTPNRLLLPGNAAETEIVQLTPEFSVSALDAWKWARGRRPLPVETAPPDRQILTREDRERLFARENQPDSAPEPPFRNAGHVARKYPNLARMADALAAEAKRSGVDIDEFLGFAQHAYLQRLFYDGPMVSHDGQA